MTIYGNLTAGGYIHARSDVDVTIDAKNELINIGVPFTLAVSSGHSRVIVGKTAQLVSGYLGGESEQREQAGVLIGASSVNDLVSYTVGGLIPFSISLSVVEFDTIARITESARIDAGGAVKVLASSIVDSTSYATGKPSIVWNTTPQSGVFVAGNFIFNTTKAVIDGGAAVTARDDVSVDAFSDVKASTVSVAIPLNNASSLEQMTPTNMLSFTANLVGIKGISGKAFKVLTGGSISQPATRGFYIRGGKKFMVK